MTGRAGSLKGRLIWIAGGTGGLGSDCVRRLAGEGATLVVGYRGNRRRAEELQREVERDFGARIHLVGGELSNPESRRGYLEVLRERPGGLHGLVCFAGDPARVKFETATAEDLLASLSDNYVGPLLLARDAARAMREDRVAGSIVLFSTMQATAIFPGSVNYAGPKAALIHAARILAAEWGGRDGIRVNVVAPGVNRAGMALKSIESGKYDPFVQQGVIPRFGAAPDVTRVVRLLLEPDNYITGQVICVDGGLTLRKGLAGS